MKLTRTYEGDSWSLHDGDETIATITETAAEDGAVLIQIAGSLRSDTVTCFQDELIALSTVGSRIVIDCGGVRYFSNACQDALVTVQQRMDSMRRGTLTLRNVPPEIYADFKKTNLHELIMIE